jgi:hypothetical protein
MSFLKNHPFAVEAYFKRSTVFTFAVPKEQLQSLIPECLQLDTFNDTYAFVALAMVETQNLRPKGFPKFMGNNFYLMGLRIFVRYINNQGKRLRGLYILQSVTDKKVMELIGNIFTHYNYTTTDVTETKVGDFVKVNSVGSDIDIEWQYLQEEEAQIPSGSPFAEWSDARRFSGPLPFTFTYDAHKKQVLIIEGVRQHWKPQPIKVNNIHVSFLPALGLSSYQLASAFVVEDVPYYWKKGKLEQWKG